MPIDHFGPFFLIYYFFSFIVFYFFIFLQVWHTCKKIENRNCMNVWGNGVCLQVPTMCALLAASDTEKGEDLEWWVSFHVPETDAPGFWNSDLEVKQSEVVAFKGAPDAGEGLFTKKYCAKDKKLCSFPGQWRYSQESRTVTDAGKYVFELDQQWPKRARQLLLYVPYDCQANKVNAAVVGKQVLLPVRFIEHTFLGVLLVHDLCTYVCLGGGEKEHQHEDAPPGAYEQTKLQVVPFQRLGRSTLRDGHQEGRGAAHGLWRQVQLVPQEGTLICFFALIV